jgi:predicted O-methyltransferase YrrM
MKNSRLLFYFLKHPYFLGDAVRRVKIRVGGTLVSNKTGRGRQIATKWAESRAISVEQFFEENNIEHRTIRLDFPEEWNAALSSEKNGGELSGRGAAADLLYSIAEAVDAHNVLETGIAIGFSSMAFLCSVSKRNGQVISTDIGIFDRTNIGKAVPRSLTPHWHVFIGPDSIKIPKAIKSQKEFDLVHYDSDKSYEGRIFGYSLLWERIRPGGLLISDDIADNTAFRDFVDEKSLTPQIILADVGGEAGSRFVGVVKKPIHN